MENFKCAYSKIEDINHLVPNPKNPNNHPDRQVELLAKIIDYQGQRSPIVVSQRSGFVTKGHCRLSALKLLGWPTVAVDYQEYESEAQEYADVVADNKIAELASHDDSMMIDEIKNNAELEDFDLELLGLDDFELPDEPDPAKDEIEDDMPTDVDTRAKLGDVWLLGEHRLVCGDATSIDDVEKLMDGDKADMVFTDPPYGMNLDADFSKMANDSGQTFGKRESKKYDNVIGDHSDFSDELINTIFYFDYCKEVFIWGADYFSELLVNKNDGSWIVWDKRSNDDGSDLDKIWGSCFELCWSKNKHKRDIARIKWAGLFGTEREDQKKRLHPTQKPILLSEWFFKKWGEGLINVVDLFGGSGSTLIACEKTNRKCYMMELDPHYCDVILSRWEKYSGKKAILNKE